jgi:DnaB-like helicase N terminal domain
MGRSIRAEQALLGAVLSDPAGQQLVLDWVRPEDMRRPYHGQVLAAMQRLRGRGVRPGPHEVRRELGNDPDLPAETSHRVVYLAELMERAPRHGHAQAYAALVIEQAVHDQMHLAGSRMAQAAGSGISARRLSRPAGPGRNSPRRGRGGRSCRSSCATTCTCQGARTRSVPRSPAGDRAGQQSNRVFEQYRVRKSAWRMPCGVML